MAKLRLGQLSITETTLEVNIPIRTQVKGMTRQTHGGNMALESLFCRWATDAKRLIRPHFGSV